MNTRLLKLAAVAALVLTAQANIAATVPPPAPVSKSIDNWTRGWWNLYSAWGAW
jgi:hypothetical protein